MRLRPAIELAIRIRNRFAKPSGRAALTPSPTCLFIPVRWERRRTIHRYWREEVVPVVEQAKLLHARPPSSWFCVRPPRVSKRFELLYRASVGAWNKLVHCRSTNDPYLRYLDRRRSDGLPRQRLWILREPGAEPARIRHRLFLPDFTRDEARQRTLVI